MIRHVHSVVSKERVALVQDRLLGIPMCIVVGHLASLLISMAACSQPCSSRELQNVHEGTGLTTTGGGSGDRTVGLGHILVLQVSLG